VDLRQTLRELPRRLFHVAQRLGPVGILAALWVAIPSFTGLWMLATLGDIADFWRATPGPLSFWGYPFLLAIGIGIGLFPVASCNWLFGWVYGWGLGLAMALVTYQVGALLGFFIAQRTSHARVEALIEEHAPAKQIRAALLQRSLPRTLFLVTLWRSAGFPFPFSNLLLTCCGVRLPVYLLATFLGLLPRVAVATFIAATAAGTGARDLRDLVKRSEHPVMMTLAALLALGVLLLITHMSRAALRRATSPQPLPIVAPGTQPASDGKSADGSAPQKAD
jgi:uncharacterized membrane protein YdjX (TVP38/TMEM64 family)